MDYLRLKVEPTLDKLFKFFRNSPVRFARYAEILVSFQLVSIMLCAFHEYGSKWVSCFVIGGGRSWPCRLYLIDIENPFRVRVFCVVGISRPTRIEAPKSYNNSLALLWAIRDKHHRELRHDAARFERRARVP